VGGKPVPEPCYLDECDYFGVRDKRKIWRSKESDFYYTWDSLHGEIEVFNRRGRHMGALDPIAGTYIKGPERGRTLNV